MSASMRRPCGQAVPGAVNAAEDPAFELRVRGSSQLVASSTHYRSSLSAKPAPLDRLQRAGQIDEMDLGLHGKRILVPGSTAGIGHAAAELFAREGAAVVV